MRERGGIGENEVREMRCCRCGWLGPRNDDDDAWLASGLARRFYSHCYNKKLTQGACGQLLYGNAVWIKGVALMTVQ